MKSILMFSAGLIFIFAAWTFGGLETVTEQQLTTFLKDYQVKVIPISREENLSYFNALVSGKDEDYAKSEKATVALDDFHADTIAFARAKAFRESAQITDPLLRRQLELVYLAYLGRQVDPVMLAEMVRRQSDIEQRFNTYRTRVGGQVLTDNEVESILRSSTDSRELEAVWKASKEIGRQMAPDIIALVKLRNQAAAKLGFANYYEMQLILAEQEPAEIAALFDQLDSLTRDAFAELKGEIDSVLSLRHHVSTNELQPWHYQNRFFQEAPDIYQADLGSLYQGKDVVALARKYFAGIGIPADNIIAHSDLYEKPGKYQHAQSIDIDRAGDVRILCSVTPGYYWLNTMLHELGHGVYDYYNDPRRPWLLRGAAHSVTTEGVALFFGRLAGNPSWLERVAGVPRAEVEPVAGICRNMLRTEQLVFSRWVQVMVRFERALYEDPDQDLNGLWWDLVEKYQLLKRPKGRNEPDWASKIHLATSPVYYHNYLMGELLASQFAHTIGSQVLRVSDPYEADFALNPKVGKYFRDKVFTPGAVYFWNDMVERATGEKLTAKYYADQFVGQK